MLTSATYCSPNHSPDDTNGPFKPRVAFESDPMSLNGIQLSLQVWTLSSAGKVSDRLVVQLPSPDAITHAVQTLGTPLHTPTTTPNPYMDQALGTAWIPGSDTCIVITMPLAVLVYDLAQSARQPLLAVIVPGSDLIASSAVGTHMVTDTEVRWSGCD